MDHVSDFTSDLNTISGLSDNPNITDALSASSLKAKFDYAGNVIQTFIRTSLVTAINALIDLSHSHSNKTLLDTYTQTEANLSTAVTDAHTHANKTLLDTYTQTETNLASAVTNNHTHSNKTVLDNISVAPVLTTGIQSVYGYKEFETGVGLHCDVNLNSSVYGTSLPSAGNAGRIFFKKA